MDKKTMTTKTCSKCGEEKPATKEFFYLDRGRLMSECKECAKAKRLDYYRNNIDEEKLNQAKYREDNKDYLKQWFRDNYERNRSDILKRQKKYRQTVGKYHEIHRDYGITKEEYDRLLLEHNHSCFCCGAKGDLRSLCIDHSHDGGQIRGILCHQCNMALGHFRDNPDTIRAVIAYLNDNLEIHQIKYRKGWKRGLPRYLIETLDSITPEVDRSICSCCGASAREGKPICLDHNHETGMFRGFLCFSCNAAIGIIHEDREILNQLIVHLEKNKGG